LRIKLSCTTLAQIQDIVSSEMQVNGSNITDIDARELFLLEKVEESQNGKSSPLQCPAPPKKHSIS
jgi:hypothetical protein